VGRCLAIRPGQTSIIASHAEEINMRRVSLSIRSLGALGSATFLLASACSGGPDDAEIASTVGAVATAQDIPITDNLRQAFPKARMQMRNGHVSRIYGAELASGVTADSAAERVRATFAKAHAGAADSVHPVIVNGLTRAAAARPKPLGLMYDSATGQYKFWLYRYGQRLGNLSVHDAELLVLVQNAPGFPVVWVNSTLRNVAAFAAPPAPRTLLINAAKSLAAVRADVALGRASVTAPQKLSRFGTPELVVFAGNGDQDAPPRLAMRYAAEDSATVGKWSVVAEAASGDVLAVVSHVHSVNVPGSVRGNVTTTPVAADCAAEPSAPLPHAEVSIPATGASTFTSSTGFFTVPNAGSSPVSVVSVLKGNYIDVFNLRGTDESLSMTVTPPNQANFLHNAANTQEYVIAQANAYYHVNRTRDFLLSYIPSYPTISTQLDFRVDVNGFTGLCPGNAWYLGNQLLFCETGFGYRNSAFGTVAYHEFGHHIVSTGGSGQGQYGEGMADTIAALVADDSRFAVGWDQTSCANVMRNADNNCQFDAVNCSSCGSEVHDCGQLISGIVWDLREQLMASNPTTFRDIVNQLTLNSVPLHTGESIDADIAIDFLSLDDNDGNIANGTPHGSEICTAFELHGIECPLTPSRPCDGLCANPVTFNWSGSYQSGPLGTGQVCRETTQPVVGGNCGNLVSPRTLSVNGTVMPCNNVNWSSVPAPRNGGYCVSTTAGNQPWSFFTLW
jgi:hypothetical protein